MADNIFKKIRIEPKFVGSFQKLEEKLESRLSAMEKKMDFLVATCSTILNACEKLLSKESFEHECCAGLLLPKILFIDDYLRNKGKHFETELENESDGCNNPVLLVSPGNFNSDENLNSNVHILTLNSEEEIVEGSWLGDSTNPKARVRVNIPPPHLMHINTHCLTPEKMALALLDCLFPKDVLAISNLSGKGKHSKKQLDPLLIYAIRCHLVYKFNITDRDWHKIKQNIDSKCRAAWRKKVSGQLLGGRVKEQQHLMVPEALSEESSDGLLTVSSSPIRILRKNNMSKSRHLMMDKPPVKSFSDEMLLPTGVELFSVVDSECFTLSEPSLTCIGQSEGIILGSSSPPGDLEDD